MYGTTLPPKTEDVSVKKSQKLTDRWWSASEAEAGKAAWAVADAIYQNQSDRQTEYAAYLSMYGFKEYSAVSPTMKGMRGTSNNRRTLANRVSLNVVKACVDTAAAEIASSRPRPFFLTSDGDQKLKKRAEALTQYMDGTFQELNIYEKGQQAFVDSGVFGTGGLKFSTRKNKLCSELVWIEDLLVDDVEAQYGSPRQIHHLQLRHREELMAEYPDKADFISRAAPADQVIQSQTKDMLLVTESWHLPSDAEDPSDGRWIVSIKEGTIADKPYKKSYFPFVFWRWNPRLRDFYGQGIAEELFGLQLEINRILRNIQIAMKRVAQPRTFLENGSNVIKQHITDVPGTIVSYSGTRPIFETPVAMNAETYNHLNWLFNKAFEIIGVSQMSASGKKPAGLDAAVAIREMNDLQSKRFLLTGQRQENAYIECARILVDLSKDLYEENPKLSVKVKTNKVVKAIKWKDVFVAEDKYILSIYPTSLLPTTPAAKKQDVIELMQAGLIDQDIALDLLDFPDLKRARSLKNAAVNDIMEILDKIVDDGVYQTPEEYMNLKLCVALGQSAYLHYRQSGLEEERLELLRRFIDDSDAMEKKPAPALPAEAASPIAQPLAAPQSEMLPV